MAHRRAPSADSDLDEIWYHIAKESGGVERADRFIQSIAERFYLLSENPHVGRRRDDDLRPGLRSFPVGQYVIIYRIEDEEVVILHVFHGCRDIEAILSPLGAVFMPDLPPAEPWNRSRFFSRMASASRLGPNSRHVSGSGAARQL